MEILMGREGEKTKPIQSQFKPNSVSPQTCSGGWKNKAKTGLWPEIYALGIRSTKHEIRKRVERLFEKTKPILKWAKW